MYRLDFTNFHTFLKANPWSVIFATPRASEELNPVVVQHFESKYGGRLAIARVDLAYGHEWFSREIHSWLSRRHASFESAYYLIVAGKAVVRHAGVSDDGAAIIIGLLLASTSDKKANLARNLNQRAAANIIGEFEGRLVKNPPPTSRAPGSVSIPAERDPYAILELPKNATRKKIDEAYKSRVWEYHPDRVASLGKDLRELAARRMAEINAAYSKLRSL